MKNNPLFSIIIPVRVETDYLRETLHHLHLQSFRSFEILVITDKISKTSNPAQKRNLGAKMSKGKYLAFLDDDSYPHKNWLKNAYVHLAPDSVAAVCGPCLTPPKDNVLQQASGLVWSSILGSGGAGYYRNNISPKRFVDDYPSVNLIVKKDNFNTVGGFNTHHWPGEDTILCLDLVYKLHHKILYHPSIIVYHHRREVIINHLKQITRYALHRGNFARIYPKTSLKIGYIMPSLCLIYALLLPFFFFSPFISYLFIPVYLYVILLLLTCFDFLLKKQKIVPSLLATISIPITHAYYGFLFIIGFSMISLKFKPHKVDKQKGKYLGG
jgi:glycosyltransferase involved in cell wall biosynthesis